ncbi:MAG: FKBP-type peptidyl-prolyl cis-trans isomerase [Phycisphaerales bacterium JB063]
MYRKHASGLVAAVAVLAAGTWAAVVAQDGGADPHEHSPSAIHRADGTHYELNDPTAYPDEAGFESMDARVCNVIGRIDGGQITQNIEDLDLAAYEEGIRAGAAETSDDRAAGYELGRNIVRAEPDVDIDAMIEGLRAAAAEDNESRAMGYLIGNGYRNRDVVLEADDYMAGVREALAVLAAEEAGEERPETTLTDEEIQETVQAFSYLIQQRQLEKLLEEGAAYRAEIAAQDGWTQTESGLLYRVVEQGEGESPDANDVVTCHYEGTLIDGTVFDSSYERGQPAEFSLNRVIGGWTEGVQLMNVGSKYEFVIPPDLAYGERGYPDPRGGGIPQNATLRFTVELLGFASTPNDDRQPLGD